MIIDGRQKPRKRLVEYFVTASGWVIMGSFVVQFVLSAMLWYFGLKYVRHFLWAKNEPLVTWHMTETTLIVAALSFAIMAGWGTYNRRRFGSLRRRSMPVAVSSQDLEKLFGLSDSTVATLQTSREILYDAEMSLTPAHHVTFYHKP